MWRSPSIGHTERTRQDRTTDPQLQIVAEWNQEMSAGPGHLLTTEKISVDALVKGSEMTWFPCHPAINRIQKPVQFLHLYRLLDSEGFKHIQDISYERARPWFLSI